LLNSLFDRKSKPIECSCGHWSCNQTLKFLTCLREPDVC
jgi:hypothetical protein